MFVIFSPLDPSRLYRQGSAGVPEKLLLETLSSLLQTWIDWIRVVLIIGASVDIEYILHAPHELGVRLWRDRPLLLEWTCYGSVHRWRLAFGGLHEGGEVPRTRPPYPPEFRREAIRLVRASDEEHPIPR